MKVVALAALVAAIAVPTALGSSSKAAARVTVNGTDGPGFTITLTLKGKKVKKLSAGSYKFVIADKSSIHNFHLIGPGVNKTTSVGKVETKTWLLTLKKGTYKYICDPHKTIMTGSFTVS
jgi:plastocyanin